MSNATLKSNNVYPKINFVKYLGEIINKHRVLVIGSGVVFATLFFLTAYFQVFTSSTIFRFKVPDVQNSNNTSGIQLEGLVGKTASIRDKSFVYLHSGPFAEILLERLGASKEGQEILKILDRSHKNKLLKIKSFFVDTYKTEDYKHLRGRLNLLKIISFKKESDDSVIMYIKSGTPEFSMQLGEVVAPIVRTILLENESFDVNVSLNHLNSLWKSSQENLNKLELELVEYQKSEKSFKGSLASAPMAYIEMEKELRMAKIETQRFDLLVKKLEKQIKDNSTFSIEDGDYKYIDQASIERLTELKQQREIAAAKASSIEKTYNKMKAENEDLPESEQLFSNLVSQLKLERTINSDLFYKTREIEGMQKLIDNSIRIVGDTSIVAGHFKLSKMFRFVLGFIGGIVGAIFAVFYYYDFFKVIKGNHDLRELVSVDILHPIPKLEGKNLTYDVWRDLPENHHALEAFRQIMEKCEAAKVVSFMSADKQEGKSFIIANLAENFSRFGKRVVVVDTNWQNPTLSNRFQTNTSVKLITAEQFKHDKDAYLDRSLLISKIKEYVKDCDMVIIDTQNLHDSNDALVVASVSNLNILLCSHFETYQHKFDTALKKLAAAELNNYCVMLNKANIKHEILSFKGRIRAMDEIEKAGPLYLKKSS